MNAGRPEAVLTEFRPQAEHRPLDRPVWERTSPQ